MTTALTQGMVNRLRESHEPGAQIYDEHIAGLRVVVGRKSSSYKLVGRINDGTKRYLTLTIGRTDEVGLRTARETASQLKLTLRRGIDPRRPRREIPTVEEAWKRYRDSRDGDLRPSTIAFYESKLRGPLKPLLKVPLDKLDREQVRSLHERVTERRGSYCANGAMRTLKTIYNDASRSVDLPPNPVSQAVRMNKERPRNWAISQDGLSDFWLQLDSMENRTTATCWMTMLMTGLRSGDARNMLWEHLDDDGVLFVPSPKGGPDRSFSIPLPRYLLQQLEQVRQETASLCSPYVFPSQGRLAGPIRELRRKASFDFAPHQMRHTYRTAALEAGIDIQTVVMLMNHRPAGVTWGYVTRAHLLGHMRDAQETICSALVKHRRPAASI